MDELTIAESMRECIIDNLDGFTKDNVVVDFPDPSSMAKNTMICIVVDESNYDALTTIEDTVTANYLVYILAKGRNRATINSTVFSVKNKLHNLLRSKQNFDDNSADSVQVTGSTYFAPDGATGAVSALEVYVTVTFGMVHA